MSRTVRNVGGLILAIILMVSMYGTYKLGTTNVGNQAFSTMHRMVAGAFGHADVSRTEPWSSSMTPQALKGLKDRIPKANWKKGVKIYDGHSWNSGLGLGGVYTLNNDGTFKDRGFDGKGGADNLSYNDVMDSVYNSRLGIGNNTYHNMNYDPKTNTLRLE